MTDKELLQAYKDTGLEPEEVDQIRRAAQTMMFPTVADFARYAIQNFEDLQKYRKAEAEGRLVVLPCKVGETIYYLNPFDEIEKGRITMIQQKANGTLKFRVTTTFSHDVTSDAIGKSVFRTREEAEAALKERENDG